MFDAREFDVARGIFAEVCADVRATQVEMDGEDDPHNGSLHQGTRALITGTIQTA